ncbi:unnamed protein product [Rhizophagus irregularis]|nr:unnamed protein product [Rhizophagus irregularis]
MEHKENLNLVVEESYDIISRNFDNTITNASTFNEIEKIADTRAEITEVIIKVCGSIAYEHYEKDNPDAFAGWNLVASFGSVISLVSAFLFLYILFNQLTSPLQVKANPWAIPAYFEPNTPLSSIRSGLGK